MTVNLDKQAQYRSRVNVLERPSAEGIELIGHHEVLLPLLHVALHAALARDPLGGTGTSSLIRENPNIEIRNPKQIQNPKDRNPPIPF